MGRDDHLLRGVRAVLKMRRSLGPAGVARVDLEPSAAERDQVVHLVQFVNRGAEFLGQIEVVRSQLVLGVVASTDAAIAARDAPGAPWSNTAEIRIVGLDTRATEVNADRGLVESLASAHFDRDLL